MQRPSVSVLAAGAFLVVLLGVLVGSVLWVSDSSKHSLVQPNPSPPTTVTPSSGPTVAAAPLPAPTTDPQPVDAMQPSQVTAEMITPPPPSPRHLRLHDLFPHLFPSG